MNTDLLRSVALSEFLGMAAVSLAQVTLNIDAASSGPRIGDLHYGIFYEEINNAGDGGIYAELIRNRSFEDGSGIDYWTADGAEMKIIHTNLLNESHNSALQLTLKKKGDGISNTGYWGIDCKKGNEYKFSFWVRSDKGYTGSATASLVDSNGNPGATADLKITANGKWEKVTGVLTATSDIPNSHFTLKFSEVGTLTIDMVSLFPPTYKGRENGCREDLAQMLEALHPKFVRFPGGCYIEGDGSVEDNRRFEWKKTIGPVEKRPGHYNFNWGYPCTDGMGFHEFLQLTEDLGAEPLFVVNIGIGHGWFTDYTAIDEYIQEALDAIEYCNGDETTYWGSQRIANGHPEPFNLRLIEIGNENYNFDDDRSDHYPERYKAFYDAIKAEWPEVTLIGNVEAWGTDTPSWRNPFHCEIVDEHYYRSPEWFEMQYNKYDAYDRTRPKIYVGEYAVTDQFGTNGHLRAALGEAVYMMGMERNSDVCIMNSYAPIFYNEERGGGWLPDMIRFSHNQSYGTPSYYVQQLMPSYLGKRNAVWSEEGNISALGDKTGLSTWSTLAVFDNIKVTDTGGNVILTEDFSNADSDWDIPSSNWKVGDGVLSQTNPSRQGEMIVMKKSLPDAYTLELDAKKESGAEGFLVIFNYQDKDNYCWWNIGGWNNTKHGIQLCKNGAKTDYDLKSGSVNNGETYRIKLEVNGGNVKCYLNGELIHDLTLPVERKVYVSTTIDDEEGYMYLKIANTKGEPVRVNLNLANASMDNAEVIVLTSATNTAENTTDNPENIIPQRGTVTSLEEKTGVYDVPAYSLNILKVRLSEINYNPSIGTDATAEQVESVKSELSSIASKLNYLHTSTALPITTPSGATIEWGITGESGQLRVNNSRFSALLLVSNPNRSDMSEYAGTLEAKITFPDGAATTLEYPVTLAPEDKWYGYLYTFMNSGKEITNYALGSKEGLGKKFDVLLDGDEIFDTKELAGIEHGTRDAFMARGQREGEYFMATTDMCVAISGKWNNHGLDLLRSSDMVHWESTVFDFREGKKIFSDPEATTDGYKSDGEYAAINRVWAPQFIWDENAFDGKGGYLVYYSLLSSNPGDDHDRMFYSYADAEFKTLTQPRLFYDPGYAVIDADIVFNNYDGLYHMMIKKEGANANDTGVFEYTSPTLLGNPWKFVMQIRTEDTAAVEGATHIRRINEDCYNLYYMRYDNAYKYKVTDLDHLGKNPSASSAVAGTGNFQHGSVMHLFENEYKMLRTWSDVMIQVKKAKSIKESTGTNVFDAAIALAEKILAENFSVDTLAEKLPEALDALYKANGEYIAANPNEFNDITSMIANPDFNMNNGDGWNGTPFTATNGGVAEHWNKTFDTYQSFPNMPAGTYRLEASGFYRYGYQEPSKKAHADGTELLLAMLYINDNETPFTTLYDRGFSTFPDNVWQANTAFNTDGRYAGNQVEYELQESGTLRIGVKKSTHVDGDWNCFDNFKLYFKPSGSGVEGLFAEEEDGETIYYNLQGVRISAPTEGIYIVKRGNKASKEVVR